MTSVYTSRWLPGLVDKVEALAAANPGFQFLFDGQTLVLEDLLALAPHYAARVRRLVASGQLLIGPYYCQPDWQLTSGELLLRNLQFGLEDVARFGGTPGAGWLVDTFGHLRQTPQLHRLFGLDAAYVWRGVPTLEPYFVWQAPDGSRLLALYLIGGYRNLYGVTHTPEVAVQRLEAEVAKLQPFYPTPDIPLFDGYDLEDDPEDPVRYFSEVLPPGAAVEIQATTPQQFAARIRARRLELPVLTSELNSGKYGATFPGALSTRTYLKVMAADCERLLFGLCEPWGALAWLKGRPYPAAQHEVWARVLLQNAVHDALCGVSIDQVHEKMEHTYRQVFDSMRAELESALAAAVADLAPGDYAVSTLPFAVDQWHRIGGELLHLQAGGVGVWPVAERESLALTEEPVDRLAWHNAHLEAVLEADGAVRLGAAVLGRLRVYRERGDTYTDERGEFLGVLRPVGPLRILAANAHYCEVELITEWRSGPERVTARVSVRFDLSPVVRWRIALDTRGVDLRVELELATGLRGECVAGMPFDLVPRPTVDADLLPRELPQDLGRVLLGQRELGTVEIFPFHELLMLSQGELAAAIFARGLHAYSAAEDGTVRLILSRSVEWLTRGGLQTRVGDAGPFFYVPDARCEREVVHEIGFAAGHLFTDTTAVLALNAAFQNPALVVRVESAGHETAWSVLREDAPLSSLRVQSGRLCARLYNPSPQPLPLSQTYSQLDVWGRDIGTLDRLAPGQIAAIVLPHLPRPQPARSARVTCLTPPAWRVGPNVSRPDPAILEGLAQQASTLMEQAAAAEAQAATAPGSQRLRWRHRYYVLMREAVEAEFSLLLNRRKLARTGPPTHADLFGLDPEIAALGLKLNRLRIKRRIFDYVVQALPEES